MTPDNPAAKKCELLARLAAVRPMPDDATVTQEQLDERFTTEELVDLYFKGDRDFVGPLLDSVGYGDGFGGYSGISHFLYGVQDREFVLAEIAKRLQDGAPGPKMWALYCLAELHKSGQGEFSGEHDLIAGCLRGPDLVRREAAHCLGALDDPKSRVILGTLRDDPSDEVRDQAANWLDSAPPQ
jgi:hypothetical protein